MTIFFDCNHLTPVPEILFADSVFFQFNWDLSEHLMKYKVAFANYDTDHDGYLMNDQARDILLQTRLDPSDLMAIWELADRPPVH